MTTQDVIGVLGSIIQVMTSGLTQMATGIGSGANAFVQNLVFVTTGTGESATTTASAFILVVALLAGISLSVSFGRKLFGMVASLGGRR